MLDFVWIVATDTSLLTLLYYTTTVVRYISLVQGCFNRDIHNKLVSIRDVHGPFFSRTEPARFFFVSGPTRPTKNMTEIFLT